MPDFTPALAKGLDALREVLHGKSTQLYLMDFARPERRGYDALVKVPSGWHLRSGKDIGELMLLEVAEMGVVTRDMLLKAAAFGIYIPGISEPLKAWVMTGDEGRKTPTYSNKKIWVFQVKATQEAANI